MAISHRRGWSAEARHESPWYFPLRPLWDRLHAHTTFPSPAELSALYAARVAALGALDSLDALDALDPALQELRFVPAPAHKPKRRGRRPVVLSELYEGQIAERRCVPTRLDDWHDFFNALTFAVFPRAKWALHQRQYRLLRQLVGPDTRRLPGARPRELDALALFDEGGIALVVAPGAAQGRSQAELAAAAAELCRAGHACAVPFGHALHEHLVEGLACPRGALHAVALEFAGLPPCELPALLDPLLARDLDQPGLFAAPSPERGISLAEIAPAAPEMPENMHGWPGARRA